MPTTGEGADSESDLRREVDRLAALVGPSEQSYADLREELASARSAAKAAESEAGRMRGTVVEREVELRRAQQDLFHVQRLLIRPVRGVAARLRRLRR